MRESPKGKEIKERSQMEENISIKKLFWDFLVHKEYIRRSCTYQKGIKAGLDLSTKVLKYVEEMALQVINQIKFDASKILRTKLNKEDPLFFSYLHKTHFSEDVLFFTFFQLNGLLRTW